jgi:flagellin FlaB
MKANQKFLMDNERGDVGVGTLIIFIAMVLVAAVAATVLIYTTGSLQQKATKTSKEATQQISSNIIVEQVIGDRTDPLDPTAAPMPFIQNVSIRIKPDVGTTSIDLRQLYLSWILTNAMISIIPPFLMPQIPPCLVTLILQQPSGMKISHSLQVRLY